MTLPLLLGEAPSKQGDRYHAFPLSGRPARVLCEAAGIPPQPEGSTYGKWTWSLYEHFDCRNLIERYADATPWRVPTARDHARAILAELRDRDPDDAPTPDALGYTPTAEDFPPPVPVIVCLGRRVQKAMALALDGDAVLKPLKGVDPWGRLFGCFGQWAAPWHIHVPRGQPGAEPVHEWAPWVVTLPHPSGLNRLMNDPTVRERVGRTLAQAEALAKDPSMVPPE